LPAAPLLLPTLLLPVSFKVGKGKGERKGKEGIGVVLVKTNECLQKMKMMRWRLEEVRRGARQCI
jgi:hypothetical protein